MQRTFDCRYVDIQFCVGSGRIESDTESRIMAIAGVSTLAALYRELRSMDDDKLQRIWEVVKATPAGQAMA